MTNVNICGDVGGRRAIDMYITKGMTLTEAYAARLMGFEIKCTDGVFYAVNHLKKGVKYDIRRSEGSQQIADNRTN